MILCKTAIGALKLNIGDLQATKVRESNAGILPLCLLLEDILSYKEKKSQSCLRLTKLSPLFTYCHLCLMYSTLCLVGGLVWLLWGFVLFSHSGLSC